MANEMEIRILLDKIDTAGREFLQSIEYREGAGPFDRGPAGRSLVTATKNLIASLEHPGVLIEEITRVCHHGIYGVQSFKSRQGQHTNVHIDQ